MKSKYLCLFITIFLFSCRNEIRLDFNGSWGAYEIIFEEKDLLSDEVYLADVPFFVDTKNRKYLLEKENIVKGDISFFIQENEFYAKLENSTDIKFDQLYKVVLDTLEWDKTSDLIFFTLESESSIIKARKIQVKKKIW